MGELQALALRSLVVLRPIGPDGLRSAIAEPARARGVTIEPALVEHLVAHTEGGSLPLLEFALGALYDGRDAATGSIGLADLSALGGVEGALAAHADAALARLPAEQRREARRLLLDLVTVERTRWRREEKDLLVVAAAAGPDARLALDALVEARLVVASAGEEATAYEVAHEALLGGWPALRGWLDEDAAAREVTERVRRAAAEWERVGRTDEALFGQRQLGELSGRSFEGASAPFVDASRARLARARFRKRAFAAGVPLLLLLVAAGGWMLSRSRRRAAVDRAVAAARALDASALDAACAADVVRAEAFALFDARDLAPAERAWTKMLALEEDTDRQRRDVGAALDEALALDPRDPAAPALYADVTLARLLAGERLHKGPLTRELARAPRGLRRRHPRRRPPRPRAPRRRGRACPRRGHPRPGSRRRSPPLPRRGRSGARARLVRGSRRGAGFLATRSPVFLQRGVEAHVRVVLPRVADVPAGMIYVPAGRTIYGSKDDEATRGFLAHEPSRAVEVNAFLIAEREVSNGEYLAYLAAIPEPERSARRPTTLSVAKDGAVVWKTRRHILARGEPYCSGAAPCVDWLRVPVGGTSREDAEGYAAWLSASGALPGARLCTDREWERAARSGADERRYPNGDADLTPSDACTLATYGDDAQHAGPCAIGTHPATKSPFGVDDMTGNEWEWVAGAADVKQPNQGIVRGASWQDYGVYLSIANRGLIGYGERGLSFGLRVCAGVRSAPDARSAPSVPDAPRSPSAPHPPPLPPRFRGRKGVRSSGPERAARSSRRLSTGNLVLLLPSPPENRGRRGWGRTAEGPGMGGGPQGQGRGWGADRGGKGRGWGADRGGKGAPPPPPAGPATLPPAGSAPLAPYGPFALDPYPKMVIPPHVPHVPVRRPRVEPGVEPVPAARRPRFDPLLDVPRQVDDPERTHVAGERRHPSSTPIVSSSAAYVASKFASPGFSVSPPG